MNDTLGIVATVLGSLGSFISICIWVWGPKPLKDVLIRTYKKMQWCQCWGGKRFKWVAKKLENSKNEVETTSNVELLRSILVTTNLTTMSHSSLMALDEVLKGLCNVFTLDDICRVVLMMHTSAHSLSWKIVSTMLRNMIKNENTSLYVNTMLRFKTLIALKTLLDIIEDEKVIVCVVRLYGVLLASVDWSPEQYTEISLPSTVKAIILGIHIPSVILWSGDVHCVVNRLENIPKM